MPVEFLDSEPDPTAPVGDGRRPGRPDRRRPLGVLVGVVALVALAVVVVAGRPRDGRPPPSPGLPYFQVHQAAEQYERHVQCLGEFSRALAAMPQAYRRATAKQHVPRVGERAVRAALAHAVNNGPGSRSFDALIDVWTAHRHQLLGHSAASLSGLADRTCRAVGS